MLLKHGAKHYQAAVGEVNVVTRMKAVGSVIGGGGDGGIILPELHYGRDALVGIALFLSSGEIRQIGLHAAGFLPGIISWPRKDGPAGRCIVQSVLDQVAENTRSIRRTKKTD